MIRLHNIKGLMVCILLVAFMVALNTGCSWRGHVNDAMKAKDDAVAAADKAEAAASKAEDAANRAETAAEKAEAIFSKLGRK